MSPTKSHTRAARLSPPERRAQLLATATRLLEQGGSDALRMDALARAAGVSRPVVYEHFEDREALIIALIEQVGDRIRQDSVVGADSGASFTTDLTRATRAYLEHAQTNGGPLRSLLRANGISPRVEVARTRIWDAAVERWAGRYRVESGLPSDDAEALATFHLHGLWSLADLVIRGTVEIERAVEIHVAIVESSLSALATARVAHRNAGGSHEWAALAPELTVTDLEVSLRFYRAAGFSVRFERGEPPFAYLDLGPAQLMLEQDHGSSWNTASLERPFGRGINLQIEVPDCAAVEESLRQAGHEVFRPAQDSWYRVGDGAEEGQRELLAHDPDGYLLRFSQPLGRRSVDGERRYP